MKPDWATRICSKLAVFGALSLSTALFAQTQPTPLPITENPFTETAVEESAPNSDSATYIPIDNRVKDGLYGFTKAVTMGVTFPLMLTVNAAPFGNPLSAANQGVYEFFHGNAINFLNELLPPQTGVFFRCAPAVTE